MWGCTRPFALLRAGVGLSRGALRFRAAHRSLRSRPYHPSATSPKTQRSPRHNPPAGQAAPENAPPVPAKPTARAGHYSTAGATLRSVPSFAPYACKPPPLRSIPRSTYPPTVTIAASVTPPTPGPASQKSAQPGYQSANRGGPLPEGQPPLNPQLLQLPQSHPPAP